LANIENIGLESTDIKLERGVIRVNAMMQTSESHIYAIGDVVGGLQLAHTAGHEGITAVEHIAGLHPHAHASHLTPRCIYSRPEIASVGWTEKQAIERGHTVKVGKFNFKAIGKALVYGDTDGFVKVIADQKTNDILGVHMIGPHVTDFISEAALAHVLEATPWEVGQTIHPHPTLSEALGEAMLAVDGKAIGM
jgi:dihydrolipoamide dehydrogenase